MDTLPNCFGSDGPPDEPRDYGRGDDEIACEPPPPVIGQSERRMQVRAYNLWAGMLEGRKLPSIEQFDFANPPDFASNGVMLDFTAGMENPVISSLGARLAEECGAQGPIRHLSDVPRGSLLSRITDHYMEILANQAPIGFEAEFVGQRGATILYRGILLPFATVGDRIDYVYGVINWKEVADQDLIDGLLREMSDALDPRAASAGVEAPLAEWADGPAADPADGAGLLDLTSSVDAATGLMNWPDPSFGGLPYEPVEVGLPAAPESDVADDPAEPAAADMGLADWLASARAFAELARGSEDRSRQALYDAIGRAYDFSLAAAAEPARFCELLADAGLTMQERAPLTPVVKLVFGAEYDKTRLAEFVSVLSYAYRVGLPRGGLADHLAAAPGGLKRIVAEERRLRREEAGEAASERETPAAAIQRQLRALTCQPLTDVSATGSEFTVLVARRLENGEVVLVGEVAGDIQLLERAARKLIG